MGKCSYILVVTIVLSAFFSHLSHLVDQDDYQPNKVDGILHQEALGMDVKSKLTTAKTIRQLALQYHLDPLLILAIIHVESHFQPEATSAKGARGLMQVMPIVFREVASQLGMDAQEQVKCLSDKTNNLRIGVHYLAFLLKLFQGDIRKTLMAYNQGPTKIARLYKHKPVPTQGYQAKVLHVYEKYSQT